MTSAWSKIHHTLTKLNCPFMSYLTSLDVLLEACEIRNAVMSWLFYLYDPMWARKLDTKELSELNSLTQMASLLGLCSHDDTAFIQGGGSKKKQTSFWVALIDIVLLNEELPEDKLDNNLTKQLNFMETIARDSRNVFKDQTFKSSVPIPTSAKSETPDLETMVAQLTTQVNELKQQLSQLSPEIETPLTRDFSATITHNLQDTHKLLETFSDSYAKDFRPWIQAQPHNIHSDPYSGVNMTDLVTSCHTVTQLLNDYKKVADSNMALKEHTHTVPSELYDEVVSEASIAALNTKLAAVNTYNNTNKRIR